ncbi:sialidase family protein [Dinoroseobacter sp. S375]|uniref:sialidase family protein n=1 Tax=Dinoroseobacter sp. S375 TaxID=3415136 RepID=UPI003C7A77D2
MLLSQWVGFWGWNANAITVSRMQDKIVETADGAIHVLLNEGQFKGLTLRTSYDNGATWVETYEFDQTGRFSTGHLEIMADGDTLTVSFQDDKGEIRFQTLDYDPSAQNWSAIMEPSTAIAGVASGRISLPNHTMDAEGTLYAVALEANLFAPKIALSTSTDGGLTWSTEVTRFGEYEAASARLVTTPEVTGVLLATDTNISWLDGATGAFVEVSDLGSYQLLASHYSVTVVGNDIYLANVTEEETPQVEFFVFDGDTQTWSERISPQNTFDSEAYVQLSSNAEGHLYMTIDEIGTGLVRVLESVDGGQNWEIETDIVVESRVEAGFTRMVAPEYFTEDLVIFQMVLPYEESSRRGVSVTVVDVDDDGSADDVARFAREDPGLRRAWIMDRLNERNADEDDAPSWRDRIDADRWADWEPGSGLAAMVDSFDL